MYESIPENNLQGNLYNGGVENVDIKTTKWNYNILRAISLTISIFLIIIEVFNFNEKRKIEKDIQDLEE